MRVTHLQDALGPLEETLGRLRECAREHLAFVIIEDPVSGRFVQFSGSNRDPLWFDAPQLGVVNSGPKFDSPRDAALYALDRLRDLRVPELAEVEIVFESTRHQKPS